MLMKTKMTNNLLIKQKRINGLSCLSCNWNDKEKADRCENSVE